MRTHASIMPSLAFSATMLLLTKVKQVFKLIKDKNERGVTLLADFPIKNINFCPVPKIPTSTTSYSNF